MVDVVTIHLEHLRQRGLSPGTIGARRRVLTRLRTALPVQLTEATETDLAAWRAGLTVTPPTVVAYLAHVRDFYGWCTATGRTPSNPATGLLSPKTGRRLPRPIAEDDLMRALDAAPARIRPWLVLAGWAGLRAVEIAYLIRDNVMEGAQPPVLLIARDATKGHRERVVPMSPFVLAELRATGLPYTGWVFPRHDGQAGPNAPWLVSQLAGAHLRSCGVNASLHQLRHRFASLLYQETRDLRLVQELLGHSSPSTTAGYAALHPAAAASAVNTLPVPLRLRTVPLEEAN